MLNDIEKELTKVLPFLKTNKEIIVAVLAVSIIVLTIVELFKKDCGMLGLRIAKVALLVILVIYGLLYLRGESTAVTAV